MREVEECPCPLGDGAVKNCVIAELTVGYSCSLVDAYLLFAALSVCLTARALSV